MTEPATPLSPQAVSGGMTAEPPRDTAPLPHLRSLIKKNLLLKLRHPVNALVELLLPVVFAIYVMVIWAISSSTDVKAENFVPGPPGTPTRVDEPFRLLQQYACTRNALAINGIRTCNATDTGNAQFECMVGDKVRVPNSLCIVGIDGKELLKSSWAYNQPRMIASLDEAIMWKWVAEAKLSWLDRFNWVTQYVSLTQGSGLILVDETGPANIGTRFADYLNATTSTFKYIFDGPAFTSFQPAADKSAARPYCGDAMAIVRFHEVSGSNFRVTVYQNQSGTPTTADLFDRLGSQGLGQNNLRSFHAGGLLSIQNALSDFYFAQIAGQPTVTGGNASSVVRPVAVSPAPFDKYRDNQYYIIMGQSIGLVMVLAYLFPLSQLTKRMVLEKETRIREAMMIMGLRSSSFYASWFITYGVQHAITAFLIAIIFKLTVLAKANFGVLFFWMFLFGLSTVALAGLFSTIFSSSRTAALMAPFLFFVVATPSFALSDGPANVVVPLELLSPMAFASAGELIFEYEVTTGLRQRDLSNKLDEVPVIVSLVMLGVDCVLYALLMLYLDNVIPSQWGTRKHPLFCFIDPIRWCIAKSKKGRLTTNANHTEDELDERRSQPDYDESADAALFEPQSSRREKPSVEVQRLRKEFGKFVAVRDLTLPLYEDDVTVLLGHNGAGKTTAIGCMTGMLEVDGGDILVYGDSVRHNLGRARQHMGYCPQHNILWDELTCFEHLQFFGRLKGFAPGERLDALAEEMLKAVDLTPKRDFPSGALSGGQKRKLSVALAFIGGSKMIFLDEPTAGMDVAARRHTWDLIRRMSKGRTILLTTHFMDEADLLGNTVAIMGHGSLLCSGSSVFLKSRLGVGYTLTVANDGGPEEAAAVLNDVIQPVIPSAERIGDTGGGELTVRLPMRESARFPELLRRLEANSATRSFAIGVTTLEEVFLRVGLEATQRHHAAEQRRRASEKAAAAAAAGSAPATGIVIDDDSTPSPAVDPVRERIAQNNREPLWKPEELGDRERATPAGAQARPLMLKRLRCARRDRRTIILQVVLPVVAILIALIVANIQFFKDAPRIPLRGDAFEVPVDTPYANCPSGVAAGAPVPNTNNFDANLNPPVSGSSMSAYLLDNFYKHEGYIRLGGIVCSSPTASNLTLLNTDRVAVVFSNESYNHAAPMVVNNYFALLAKVVTGNDVNWDVGLDMLPLSFYADTFVKGLNSWIFGTLILIPFTFIPSTFVGWIVKERESKAKHLQLVSGLHFSVYWLCNYLFDFLSFLVTMFLVIVLFLIFDREEYVGTGKAFAAIFLLLLLFGFASIAGAYLLSFAFDSHATAQNVVMFVNFVVGFFFVVLIFFLEYQPSTESVARGLKWVFRLHPAYCLGDGITNLSALSLIEIFTADSKGPLALDVVGYDLIFMAVEAPLFMLAVFLLDHPSRELKQHKLTDGGNTDPETAMIENEDSDVHAEREAVEHGPRRTTDVVSVIGLRKTFNLAAQPREDREKHADKHRTDDDASPASGGVKIDEVSPSTAAAAADVAHDNEEKGGNVQGDQLVAVRNLTFGVQDQEVFGFLGTNGAGKTTTMNILTGAFPPTCGTATVMGHDCTDEAVAARRYMGYCPQFDALSDLLTPPEHIELYAGLRGIAPAAVPTVVSVVLTLCELNDYRNTLAGELSGGNRRKLSVAIALVGGPRVVFLDEPSAGMDPVARRGLWTAVQRIAHQCAVVLTTHHLEEVEALAHRIAIMVDGEMRVLGTLSHIKRKFGSGFELSVRLSDPSFARAARTAITSLISGSTLEEARGQRLTFALPPNTVLSDTFEIVEGAKNKPETGITDYSISQTSVEQVFLRAKHGTLSTTAAV